MVEPYHVALVIRNYILKQLNMLATKDHTATYTILFKLQQLYSLIN